jgi:hypothetical protein
MSLQAYYINDRQFSDYTNQFVSKKIEFVKYYHTLFVYLM